MKNVTFTKSEYVLLKIADDVINLCPPTNEVLSKVPKFAQTINLLREKRNFITEQSAKMHQAKSSKETLVVNASQEKTNLIGFITDALGMLEEYADQEKAGQLKKQVPNLRVSNLNKQKGLVFDTTINAFVATIEKLDAAKLAEYGIDSDWLPMLKAKNAEYIALNSSKETSKTNQPKETSQFKLAINDIKGYLKTLTKLVGGYKMKAPAFYEDCFKVLSVAKKPVTNTVKKTPTQTAVKMTVSKAKHKVGNVESITPP